MASPIRGSVPRIRILAAFTRVLLSMATRSSQLFGLPRAKHERNLCPAIYWTSSEVAALTAALNLGGLH